jgi:predicted lipase
MGKTEPKMEQLKRALQATRKITVDNEGNISQNPNELGKDAANEIANAIKELIEAVIEDKVFYIEPGKVIINVVGQATGMPNTTPIIVKVK